MRQALRSALLLVPLASCLLLLGCGKEVAHGGVRSPASLASEPRVVRKLGPTDLLPADLDLVVRVDLARMRRQLGPLAKDLPARAVEAEDEDLLLGALESGDVVWVGTRLGELDSGDRVVIVEGRFPGFSPDAATWVPLRSPARGARVFERRVKPSRAGTERIVAVGDEALAFITPVEVDSVERVLGSGPDPGRADPHAQGFVSVDLRSCKLPPDLADRYASLAHLADGLEHVRATAEFTDGGLRIDVELRASSPDAASRVLTFLDALRDESGGGRLAAQILDHDVGWPRLEQSERTVYGRVNLGRALLIRALSVSQGPYKDCSASPNGEELERCRK